MKMRTGAVVGVQGHVITVPQLLAKMPKTNERETRVRVNCVLQQCGIPTGLLQTWLRTTKEPGELEGIPAVRGCVGDLSILLAYAGVDFDGLVVGELGLNGTVRPVRGIVPMLRAAKDAGLTRALIPWDSYHEAKVIEGIELVLIRQLADFAIEALRAGTFEGQAPPAKPDPILTPQFAPSVDDIQGELRETYDAAAAVLAREDRFKRHVLLVGPPGSGKTMVARRLVNALPPIDDKLALELATVLSACGMAPTQIPRRPFRAPHHTASEAALLGGGRPVRPGEVTLAYEGILFLDDLPEFNKYALNAIARSVQLGCAQNMSCLPSKTTVVAAMNPCPCGWYAVPARVCRCTKAQIKAYDKRVSWFIEALDMTVISVGRSSLEAILALRATMS